MKKLLPVLFLLFCMLAYVGNAPNATATTLINDDYYGFEDHGYGDVIGADYLFGVSSMEVSYVGDTLTVDVQSRYLNNIGSYGTTLTDLFISTDGWNPNKDRDHYLNDSSLNGEDWEYALVLDSHNGSSSSGELFLHSVPTGDGHIMLSDEAYGNYTYRNSQEVLFNPGTQASLATGSWSIINGASGDMDDIIRFTVEYEFGAPSLAFHYASATCANDVIEGAAAPVPEPATILLSGMGLMGMGSYLRRRSSKKS